MEESSMVNLDEFQSQKIVMDTTTKTEYMTALVAAKEGICVKKLVYQTRSSSKKAINMKVYCMTIVSTCFYLKEPRSHQRTKFIQCHLI